MKSKKIRGHRRRWKSIDRWVESHKHLDLDYLNSHQRDYAKIRVKPWSGIPVTDSNFPEPTGITKTKMIAGLLEIYDSWKRTLDRHSEPYYLKVWLFEPRFSQSQVVCSIGEALEFYENTFHTPEEAQVFNPNLYGSLKHELSQLNWTYALDEDHIDNIEPGHPNEYASLQDFERESRRIKGLLKQPHRTTVLKESIGGASELYSINKGVVWIGGSYVGM